MIVAFALLTALAQAARPPQDRSRIPHGQDRPPGDPLTPEEAVKKMWVPEGFCVEIVASEPEIVNPVAMTFDERGRIWITESLEYPRKSAGPGRDRIKILEDTHGTGRADKITIFAEGLNIPSGIAVGAGGIWVANAPDILFMKEADGKPVSSEVVATGFGRHDTHELPNSLTWGPDGRLYGLNGVFNQSVVGGRSFTCAMFRIDPRTRAFEIFAEGTSNPWGIAYDNEGSSFVSACVIDHLFHIVETGYYHRQGGAYPPYVEKMKMGSIVKHLHQKAAYCGIHWFDSDAYPPEYREKLYMGNIHGGCINVDSIDRDGSTYFGRPEPDFLVSNDAWFMPVSQKTGPDGCLYILDWYDRYHCYQDAGRDPAGIDRTRGRLYRVRYKDTPRAQAFDLGRESDDQLISRLGSPNVYFRDTARRILTERATSREKLENLALDARAPRKARMGALWALVGGGPLSAAFHRKLLHDPDSGLRSWGVRAAGDQRRVDAEIRDAVAAMAHDPSPDVRLQVAIAAKKVEGLDPLFLLVDVLSRSPDDKAIGRLVWMNLNSIVLDGADRFAQLASEHPGSGVSQVLPISVDRLAGAKKFDAVARLSELAPGPCLKALFERVKTGQIRGDERSTLGEKLAPLLRRLAAGPPSHPGAPEAARLAVSLGDSSGLEALRRTLASADEPEAARIDALETLILAKDSSVLESVKGALRSGSVSFRARVLAALGRLEEPAVAGIVLDQYHKMEPDLSPKAIELLTQRAEWGRRLVDAVSAGWVPADALGVNQARRLLQAGDAELARRVAAVWGTVREARNPERERATAEMGEFLAKNRGEPKAGREVFRRVCAQCHTIYGEGKDVGPDLTNNGRGSWDALLSNVFDPSLVIGVAYQLTIVATKDGRVLSGIVAEDSPERIVLKLQGGEREIIPASAVKARKTSQVSMMPEGLENQITRREIADLFAFLTLDKPPEDPAAKPIPGAPK